MIFSPQITLMSTDDFDPAILHSVEDPLELGRAASFTVPQVVGIVSVPICVIRG